MNQREAMQILANRLGEAIDDASDHGLDGEVILGVYRLVGDDLSRKCLEELDRKLEQRKGSNGGTANLN